jgi:hypothetical protein
VVLIPAKFQEEIDAFDLSDYYKSYEDFTQIINDLDANRKKDLDLFSEEIRVLLKKYDEAFSSLFKGYNLKGKIGKIDDKIRELDQISSDRYVAHSRAHSSLKKILRIKDLYFSTDNVQERKKHLIEFAYLLDSLKHTKGLFGFSDLGQVKHVLHK